MSDLPQGWAEACIQDIAEVNPGRLGDIAVDAQISFVPMPAVSDIDGEIVNPSIRSYGEVSRGYTQFREGDVIFAKITPCMENGKIAIARALEGGVACGSTEFHVVRPSGGISSDFLWRYLRQKSFRNDAEASMTGAVGQRRVPAIFLKEHSVALPPLPEQQRIVAKIDSLTSKSRRARDHLDHIPRLVQKYKQAILAAAFRGELCVETRPPKLLPLSEFVDSLDQGWSPKCASEPADANDWGVIKTTAIQPVQFLPHENKRLPASLTPRPGIVINAGDVLITRAGPRSRVAISCFVTENYPKLMLCDKAYRLRTNPEMADPAFLTYMLNTPQCLSELEVMKTGISDSGLNLTQGKFMALEIPAFSLSEQSEIIRRIKSAFAWIDRLAANTSSARKLIDHLDQAMLTKAFKGELVAQDPADEPASALLDRIRERAAEPKAKRGRKEAA
ncbi:MAG: restriction endonuclease subunit S [Achromobacter sp.]|uniref:restriction endonuclease subunit S n=1 Tax=Achromobacter sp. TaxID=134375 RepID=UPI0029BB7CB1|nr:restriction endonuclease subunit S [Achromobacter sp.]MDX3984088.1 restriction endonuclease subunit S [Achromobacter sp.]